MLTVAKVTNLIGSGFELIDIQGNTETFEELADRLDASTSPDILLDNVSYITHFAHRDFDMGVVLALKWLMAYSPHMGEEPIRYLEREGFHRGSDTVLLAAEAYCRQLPADEWQAEHLTGKTAEVVPISAAKGHKRRKN